MRVTVNPHVKGTSLSHNSRTDVMKAWANKA
jgi:hypothetical protein